MKKILFTALLSICPIANVSPCEQLPNIKKAFVIVESVLRHAQISYVCPFEAQHALQVYIKEFRAACEDCQQVAYFEYNQSIITLERIFEESKK